MTPLIVLGIFGALAGYLSDRLAARWPEHPDGMRRGRDWRTAVLVATGALAFAALAVRWPQPAALAVLVPYFLALLVLMATDLDQRLLPDLITLPLIPAALAVVLAGQDPLLAGKGLGAASGLIAAVGAPAVLAASNLVLRGGLGVGDLKLAVSLGLMSGVSRLVGGFLLASAASSVVLIALLLLRRLSLRSPIPYGPILIAGGMVAALLP